MKNTHEIKTSFYAQGYGRGCPIVVQSSYINNFDISEGERILYIYNNAHALNIIETYNLYYKDSLIEFNNALAELNVHPIR